MRKAAATATNASETEGAIIKETIQNSSIISSVRHFVVAAGQHLLLLLHLLFALLDGQNNGKRGGIIEPTHTSTPSLCACVRHWLRFAFKESLCKEGWGGERQKKRHRAHSKTKLTKMSTEGNIKIDGFFFNTEWRECWLGRGWFGVDWIGIGHGCGLLEGREESSFCDSFSFVSWNNWL